VVEILPETLKTCLFAIVFWICNLRKKKKLIWIDLLTAFDINPRRHAFAKTSVRVAQKQVQTHKAL
jgi:hypothetical protein